MPKFGNPAQHLAQHPPNFFGTSNPPKFIGYLHPTSPMTFPLTKEDELGPGGHLYAMDLKKQLKN